MSSSDFLNGLKAFAESHESLKDEVVSLRKDNEYLQDFLQDLEGRFQKGEERNNVLVEKIEEQNDLIFHLNLGIDEQLSQIAGLRNQIREHQITIKRLQKIDRIVKRFAATRDSQRFVDVKSVRAFKIGDIVLATIEGKATYVAIQKINARSLTVQRQTGGTFLVDPSKLGKTVFSNEPFDIDDFGEEDSSSSDNNNNDTNNGNDQEGFSSEEPSSPLNQKRLRESDHEEEHEEEFGGKREKHDSLSEPSGEGESLYDPSN